MFRNFEDKNFVPKLHRDSFQMSVKEDVLAVYNINNTAIKLTYAKSISAGLFSS